MARTKRKANLLTPVPAPAEPAARIYKATGYIRLSVEDVGKPGADTLEGQKALIRSFISQQPDMELVGLFCDNGKTGTDFARPQFEQMMELVRRGKADCLVVKDLSRFGRNYKETGNYLERIFPFLGVRFVAINDAFDTLSAERTQEGYGMQYQIVSNKNDELMQLFHHTCEKNGIVHDNRKIFEYLSTFETKCDNVQLSLFDKDFAGKSPNGI